MKIIKNIFIVILLLIPFTVFWDNNIDWNTQKAYLKFYIKLNNEYKYDDLLSYLYSLNEKIIKLNNSGKINLKNNKILSDIQKLNNEKIFSLELINSEYAAKTEIEKNSLFNNYNLKLFNNEAIIKEDWVWYTYIFEKKYYFENLSKINTETLEHYSLTWDNVLVYYEDWKINFIKEFEKKKLITDSIIYGIPNKYSFLKTLKNNKIFTNSDDDDNFYKLKLLSLNLTEWVYTDDEKIKIIYWYIIKNIDYSLDFSLDDYEIYSWIETFINKSWVCEGYAELFNAMLSFINIESEIVSWDVINATDFPDIWHAWVKIWEMYYDPTFDDPTWLDWDYDFNDYSYYNIPEDLFYTNRYNYDKTPDSLKNTTLEYREELIRSNLFKLVTKYKNSSYKLLNPFYFREKYSIDSSSEINIEDLINILWEDTMIEDNSNQIIIKLNWEDKYIKNISYMSLNDINIEAYLKQIDYNLDWYKFIKRIKNNDSIEYILSSNITYH